jgi:3-phosphoshikimate 1-carboxyvinyltransferase
MFTFKGDIILSKSWLNRAQIIYFFAQKDFPFQSDADDVKNLRSALSSIGKTTEFNLGLGGTSFRFFIFLISGIKGSWTVKAEESLLKRPQKPLQETLSQLGVTCLFENDLVRVESSGWNNPPSVQCDAGLSSQFVSGLLLSCWNLNSPLNIIVPKPVKSKSYLEMTLALLQKTGMKIEMSETEKEFTYKIAAGQSPQVSGLKPEADLSSAFSLAAAAVVNGEVEIRNWPAETKQPDQLFLNAFKKMGINFDLTNSQLKIVKHKTWNGCELNLEDAPDLFPVLSALCALGEGRSKLSGAEHLRHKESDRIKKTKELLQICGIRSEELPDGLVVYGNRNANTGQKISFDPSDDHRMAMAAAIFKLGGWNIEILHPEVVNKSYPSFWNDVAL